MTECLQEQVDQLNVPVVPTTKGGIDLNSLNLNLQIKRDGNGVPDAAAGSGDDGGFAL